MYEFLLKHGHPKIEAIMDELMNAPHVPMPKDPIVARKFGIYAAPLKKAGYLKIYSTPPRDSEYEAIVVLKINNYHKPNNVIKKKGKRIEYIFKDTLIPRIKFPEI